MFIITQNQDKAGFDGFDFTSGDSHLVIAAGVIVTTDEKHDAIFCDTQYTNVFIENLGFLSGATGILIKGDTGHVYNAVGAAISGDDGVTLEGTDGLVTNYGSIASSGVGVEFSGSTNSLVNYGSIDGQIPVYTTGNNEFVHNFGTIAGNYGTSIEFTGANAQIDNQGILDGSVDFGSGTNLFSGSGGSVIGDIVGGTGADTFDLSHQIVTGLISGGDGADIITGTSGDDTIEGGSGADHLDGGPGVNTASYQDATLGVSVDLLFSSHGTNDASGDTLVNFQNLTGSDHSDTLEGNTGDNVLSGGDGNDLLYGRGGNDTIDGGTGNDIIYAGTGSSHYEGGVGSDLISFANLGFGVTISLAQQGASPQALGASALVIDGFEALSGSAFNDTLIGDGNANMISGGSGDDHINGGLGNDTILGGAGNDTLVGGGGIDTVSYADALVGVTVSLAKTAQQNTVGSGLDTISGFANLIGSNYNDTLTGTSGANTFSGLSGQDTITGGGGHDTFNISSILSATNITTITDFSPTDDVFALNRAVFGTIPPSAVLPLSSFYQGAAAHAPADRIIYDSASGNIYYDDDGNGSDAAIQFAHVNPGLALTASDFHVYGVM